MNGSTATMLNSFSRAYGVSHRKVKKDFMTVPWNIRHKVKREMIAHTAIRIEQNRVAARANRK